MSHWLGRLGTFCLLVVGIFFGFMVVRVGLILLIVPYVPRSILGMFARDMLAVDPIFYGVPAFLLAFAIFCIRWYQECEKK